MSWKEEVQEIKRREELAAKMGGVEEVIDPRTTRRVLCDWAELAYGVIPTVLGEKQRGMRP